MALDHFGVKMSEAEIRRILKTKPYSGTHPINLLHLGELGFDAWPYEGTASELRQRLANGLPVVVFLWTGVLVHWASLGGVDYLHSVVVVGYSEADLSVHDPMLDEGPIEIPWPEFKEAWQYSRQMMAIVEPRGGRDEVASR